MTLADVHSRWRKLQGGTRDIMIAPGVDGGNNVWMAAGTGDRRARLQLLLRENRRKGLLLPFIRQLSMATGLSGEDLTFLPLDKSDGLRNQFDAAYKAVVQTGNRIVLTFQKAAAVQQALDKIAERSGAVEATVFFQKSEKIGALRIAANRFFRLGSQFLIVDRNTIFGGDEDFASGFILDVEDLGPGKKQYELTLWGRWHPTTPLA